MWDSLVLTPDLPPNDGRDQAAVLAPLYEDEEGAIRLILTKRPLTMPTHAGHIAFPGGRPDDGDDGPVATALREAREEVGIEPDQVEVLGFLPAVNTVEFSLLVVPVIGRLRVEPVLRPSPREVARILTPYLADLANEGGWRFENWRGHRVWFYELEEEVLWGATAWMVRTMLGMAT